MAPPWCGGSIKGSIMSHKHRFLLAVVTPLMAIATVSCGKGESALEQDLKQAKAQAIKWKPDAELVSIELIDFGFATDPSTHLPDMSKPGPPAIAMYNFWSPSARDGIRVDASL